MDTYNENSLEMVFLRDQNWNFYIGSSPYEIYSRIIKTEHPDAYKELERKGMLIMFIYANIMQEPRINFKKLHGTGTFCGEDGIWTVNIKNIAHSFGNLGELLSMNTVAVTTALTVFHELAHIQSELKEEVDSEYFHDLSLKLINETTDYKALLEK